MLGYFRYILHVRCQINLNLDKYKMSIQEINASIVDLWKRTKGEEARVPFCYSEIKIGGILFVGMNPSFNESSMLKNIEKSGIKGFGIESFKLSDENLKKQNIKNIIEFDEYTRDNYPYFSKFKTLAENVGMKDKWEHVDLFCLRETSQHDVAVRLGLNKNSYTKFAEEQLGIFSRLVTFASPKVIIVANAKASSIYKDMFKSKFDDEVGYYHTEIKGNSNSSVPTFFTSMLTGQRALDNFSFERLQWHVKRALLASNQAS